MEVQLPRASMPVAIGIGFCKFVKSMPAESPKHQIKFLFWDKAEQELNNINKIVLHSNIFIFFI